MKNKYLIVISVDALVYEDLEYAPTFATVLGINLPDAQGRAVDELFI